MTEAARPVRNELKQIYQEADRAAKIVRNLLVFTGSQRMARQKLRVDRVLARAIASRAAHLQRRRHRGRAQPGEHCRRARRSAPAAAGVPEHPDQRRARRDGRRPRPAIDHDRRRDSRRSRQDHDPRQRARASPPTCCRGSSTRSSRRKMSARGPDSAWRSPTGSSRNTAGRFVRRTLPAAAPCSRSSCRQRVRW